MKYRHKGHVTGSPWLEPRVYSEQDHDSSDENPGGGVGLVREARVNSWVSSHVSLILLQHSLLSKHNKDSTCSFCVITGTQPTNAMNCISLDHVES